MRSYLPTARHLPFVVSILAAAACAGGSSTDSFGGDGGLGVGEGGGGRDGTANGDSRVILPGDAAGGKDGSGSGSSSTSSGSGSGDGSATNGDGGPKQTCVNNGDCTAPNLCAGNNGMACLGGFCVATNMPMNCADGVPCTTDTCDTTTNKCVYVPNDANCPAGQYCDVTMNCVAMLPCTPGDGVCDRLDTTACAGLWACGASNYCVHEPAPCPARANATTTCGTMPVDGGVLADAGQTADGGSIPAECSWACNMGYVDANGDLDAPIGQMSNGCECQDTNPIDLPDYPNFADTNCDGIDGTVADAIFVDTMTGNDTNPGTMALPKKTIQAGVNAAGAASSPMGFPSPHKDVYVSLGTYSEHVSMVNGVSIYGGYDAATKWSRSLSNETLLASPDNVGITASGLAHAFSIQLFTITTPTSTTGTAPNGGGQSAYGIQILSCSGGVTVQGCSIAPGPGAAAPTMQSSGAAGAIGAGGGNASNESQGGGGSSSCGANGGPGGAGVGNINNGANGSAGTTLPGGGQGGPGGIGGSSGNCSLLTAGGGGNGNPPSTNGINGTFGVNAMLGPAIGTTDAQGNYLPASGVPGVSAGEPGGGGGGGGSGGGTQHGCGFLDDSCCESDSGGGGGGGGGGCGGAAGGGGFGGGGSIAILVVSSSLNSSSNTMSPGKGGAGGPGGEGGLGGSGGGGGAGGANTNAGDHAAGNGASGAQGGSGGKGGGGSGGAGGPSACFAYSGTTPISAGDTCNASSGGAGGAGGGNGQSTAATGPTGLTGTVNVQ